jgi:hypothetical protein
MIELLTWLKANPNVTGGLLSATLAASVAFIVFAVTQLLTSKRNRAQFLVPKLEELYLLVNKEAAENAAICTEAFRAIAGDKEAQEKIRRMDHLDLYGHRRAKEFIMYIRLYFPRLGRIHQLMFAAQQVLNDRLFEVSVGEMPTMPSMLEAAGLVSHFVKLMEAEIVNNRDALIGDRLLPRRYRESSNEELEAVTPPPDVPIWTKQAEEPSKDSAKHN